jgi:hypothetical protein
MNFSIEHSVHFNVRYNVLQLIGLKDKYNQSIKQLITYLFIDFLGDEISLNWNQISSFDSPMEA